MDALTRYRRDLHDPPLSLWSIAMAGGIQLLLLAGLGLLEAARPPLPPLPPLRIDVALIPPKGRLALAPVPAAPVPAAPKIIGPRDTQGASQNPAHQGPSPLALDPPPEADGIQGTGTMLSPPSRAPTTDQPPQPAPLSMGDAAALPTVPHALETTLFSDQGIADETSPGNDPASVQPQGSKSTGSASNGQAMFQITVRSYACPAPTWPQDAIRRRAWGRVELDAVVSTQGRIERLSLTQSSGFAALDQAAEQALRRCRFLPAENKDGPFRSTYKAVYIFNPP